jgi:hypothetical protein
MTIRVTVEDTEAGTSETCEVPENDYFLITTGTCHEDGVQVYPTRGTHVITIKGRGGARRTDSRFKPSDFVA